MRGIFLARCCLEPNDIYRERDKEREKFLTKWSVTGIQSKMVFRLWSRSRIAKFPVHIWVIKITSLKVHFQVSSIPCL